MTTVKEKIKLLYHLCKNNDIEGVKNFLLQPKININCKYYRKYTPLHLAVRNNSIEMVKILLADERINPNCQDFCGYTPLHSACCRSYEIVKLLLAHPLTDVNIGCNGGTTPLLLAIDKDDIDIIRELMKHPNIDYGNNGDNT